MYLISPRAPSIVCSGTFTFYDFFPLTESSARLVTGWVTNTPDRFTVTQLESIDILYNKCLCLFFALYCLPHFSSDFLSILPFFLYLALRFIFILCPFFLPIHQLVWWIETAIQLIKISFCMPNWSRPTYVFHLSSSRIYLGILTRWETICFSVRTLLYVVQQYLFQ